METAYIALGGFLIAAVSTLLSYIVAKKYGDVAAVKASRKLHEEDIRKARLTALQSLLNEVERIEKVVDHNRKLDPSHEIVSLLRMPVEAFETAFVSGKPGVDVSEGLIQAATDYLVHADSINSLVVLYPALVSAVGGVSGQVGVPGSGFCGYIVQQARDNSEHKFPNILKRLKIQLEKEIQQVTELSYRDRANV